jgi:TrmH family RNA methyltransferase
MDGLRIDSRQNPRVKDAVRLRQRSHRNKTGLFLIEGYRELARAAENKVEILHVFYCPAQYQGENEPALLDTIKKRCGAELLECSDQVFEKLSFRDRPEGLLAVARQKQLGLNDLVLPDNPLIVIAESVEKPGNLGTILRSADAAGVDAVIVCDRCTDIHNPNVVRASIGTLFTMQIAEADSKETLDWARSKGINILAATPDATMTHVEVDLSGPTALALGTEQYGLSELWMKHCDSQVIIPMYGKVDSLNVAAAATILLYEAVRQRRLN